ncbi:MAG: hypothetical protein G01um101418_891 [Parcubacteria group bacterium Gr01-1014_18]|nr:MAG: hypothetical protein Greene041636_930 [Parcubacteria group bacterium Greene0416_36]TSC79787.1 MAG: hypothetical protein G01um101418_891 [Parcubacteria group bacterium Gr01-1014_18]TSC98071.1 MAG: hypothetical protein Greene101420_900 [Parcubacteria group bacterium Greene1014_20]TSD06506.1 MAG: hypothetical protein Greene07142_849 [Parcubacteria group bacterium Greene0714_2]
MDPKDHPIKIIGKTLSLNAQYLGTDQAELWIGPSGKGFKWANDTFIKLLRLFGWIMRFITQRPSGISAIQLVQKDGWYAADTSGWREGYYRFNWHTRANEPSPKGSVLDPSKRDLQYSWALSGGRKMEKAIASVFSLPTREGSCLPAMRASKRKSIMIFR